MTHLNACGHFVSGCAYKQDVGGSSPSLPTSPLESDPLPANDGLFHLKRSADSAGVLVPSEFLERFLLSFSPEPMSGCWLWLKSLTPSGYGQVAIYGRPVVAHRVSYELFREPIPFGLTLDHLCRTRCCINPLHLEPVSRGENVRRGDAGLARGMQLRSKTLCPRGHEYSGDNLLIKPRSGGGESRNCRTCRRDLQRIRRSQTLSIPEVHPCAQ